MAVELKRGAVLVPGRPMQLEQLTRQARGVEAAPDAVAIDFSIRYCFFFSLIFGSPF